MAGILWVEAGLLTRLRRAREGIGGGAISVMAERIFVCAFCYEVFPIPSFVRPFGAAGLFDGAGGGDLVGRILRESAAGCGFV